MLRGKRTEKVAQFRHDQLSTFGIGADLSEAQWRTVLRQLVALGHVVAEGEYNTLALTPSARAVLKGEVNLRLRVASDTPRRERTARPARAARGAEAGSLELDSAAQARLAALKAWRTGVAREHNLPAYVVFHDAALTAMARQRPRTLDELAGIGGVGAKKLQAYGEQLLQLLGSAAGPAA